MSVQRFESGPATKSAAITPSDSADFPAPDTYTKGLVVLDKARIAEIKVSIDIGI